MNVINSENEREQNEKFKSFLESISPHSVFSQRYNLEYTNPEMEKQFHEFSINIDAAHFNYIFILSASVDFIFYLIEIIVFQVLSLSSALFGICLFQISVLFVSIFILVWKNSIQIKRWLTFLNNMQVHINIILALIFFTVANKESFGNDFERTIIVFMSFLSFSSACEVLLFPYDKLCPLFIAIVICFDIFIFLFILLIFKVYTFILLLLPYWLLLNFFTFLHKFQRIKMQRNIFILQYQLKQIYTYFDAIVNKTNSIVYLFKKRDLVFQSLNAEQLMEKFINVCSNDTPDQKRTKGISSNNVTHSKDFIPTATEIDNMQLKNEFSSIERFSIPIPNSLGLKKKITITQPSSIHALLKRICLISSQDKNMSYENPNDLGQLLFKEYPGKKKISLNKLIKFICQKKEGKAGDDNSDKLSFIGPIQLDYKNIRKTFELFMKVYYTTIIENGQTLNCPMIQLLFNDITEKIQIENDKKEQEQIKKQFAHLVHEFKTPLNAIISASERVAQTVELSAGKGNTVLLSTISNIISLSSYVQFLIKDIIDVSQGKDYTYHLTNVHLSDILQFCYHVLTSLISLSEAKERNIKPILDQEYIIQNGGDDIVFQTDETRLKQILLNFISNSVKFTSRGFIELKASLNDALTMLYISVRDTGSGMKDEDQVLLFRPDNKIDQSIQNQFGSGLGLAISKKIAAKLRMNLDVDSIWQKGSIFRISIDRAVKNRKHQSTNTFKQSPLPSEHKILSRHSCKDLNTIFSKHFNKNLFSCDEYKNETSMKEKDTVRHTGYLENPYSHPDILSIFAYEQKSSAGSQKDIGDKVHLSKRLSINDSGNFQPGISRGMSGRRINKDKEQEVIIVVDDLKDARKSFINNINFICSQNKKNYTILEGSDGIDCLKIVVDHCSNVKCVLLDENMEYLGGSETGRILKNLMNSNKINKFLIIEISSGSKKEVYYPYDFAISKPVEKSRLEELFKKNQIM